MSIALGIDTGGTYTDAVLADHSTDEVLASAKALTTPQDLAVGIAGALAAVLGKGQSLPGGRRVGPGDVRLVGLSTTLATNAIVEGHGHSVCLLLIGYDPSLIRRFELQGELVTDDVVYVGGGHSGAGEELAPLDEAAVRQAVLDRRGRVEAFAISGYFGVRNPAHELRARDLVEEVTQGEAAVTCGHELASGLDSVRRATTVALNARLIPLLRELITTVSRTLDQVGVRAPLMIVKGDGSLVQADWALRRPIETILSGPAASVVGAWHLAGRRDTWVIDVGGTTTDIAVLRGGLPRLNPEGARVGGWRTMIETIDVHTVGLGGDSHVRLVEGRTHELEVAIGPRRVVPLSLLARDHEGVVAELRQQLLSRKYANLAGQFVLRRRARPDSEMPEFLRQVDSRPRSLVWLAEQSTYGLLSLRDLDRHEGRRLILRAGFTPTDALHALGRLDVWNGEAARLGAELLASQVGMTVETFCRRVTETVSAKLATELVTKVLGDEGALPDWRNEPAAAGFMARARGEVPRSDLECRLRLKVPVVAVGAPVEAYMPRAAEHLATELIIPPHASVANALGAVAGGVVQHLRVVVRPTETDGIYHVQLPDGVREVNNPDDGIALAERLVPPYLEARMREAGADEVEVRMARDDRMAAVAYGWGENVLVETQLLFTASGRPRAG
ncbi:MAG: hydantoinase/oxoprolinase family protein [Gemmatimonadota bacterium]